MFVYQNGDFSIVADSHSRNAEKKISMYSY